MRQLGRHQFEKHPGRHQPGDQKALHRQFMPAPGANHRRNQEQRPGPETRHRQQQIGEGRGAVQFAGTDQLGQQIAAERVGKKTPLGGMLDRDQPGCNGDDHGEAADRRVEAAQPARLAIGDRQGGGGHDGQGRSHPALEKDRGDLGAPEHHRYPPRHRAVAAGADIGEAERSLPGDDGEEQRRVGLGDMRLGNRSEGARQQHRGDHRGIPRRRPVPEQRGTEREDRQHRRHRAEQRRQAIGPDRRRRGRAEGADRNRLQPVDPGRFLVARLVLEANAQEIPGLQHLPRRLGKARLVAVERRDRGDARQIEQEAQAGEQGIGAQASQPAGKMPHLSRALSPPAGSPSAAAAKPAGRRAARHG